MPELAGSSDVRLELAVGEFRAKSSAENADRSLGDLTNRFPDLAPAIRARLAEARGARDPSSSSTKLYEKDLPVTLGRYLLVRELGKGGFGVVWQAVDQELRRHVALKLPRVGRFQTPCDAELFLAEARALAQMRHPQIVPVTTWAARRKARFTSYLNSSRGRTWRRR